MILIQGQAVHVAASHPSAALDRALVAIVASVAERLQRAFPEQPFIAVMGNDMIDTGRRLGPALGQAEAA